MKIEFKEKVPEQLFVPKQLTIVMENQYELLLVTRLFTWLSSLSSERWCPNNQVQDARDFVNTILDKVK